ncbi:MAG: hypothetical protein MI702_05535, partial [Chlorobiales bacterium]|nr:hypothetical protein [Chlorobiales bacterium]
TSGWRMRTIRSKNRWEDVMLISTEGDILYSARKGKEQGENVFSGSLKNSSLGATMAKLRDGVTSVEIADFAPYSPAPIA